MSEEWRPVVGHEGLYEVSSKGRVRSVDRITPHGRRRRSQIMRQSSGGVSGHLYVGLSRDAEPTSWTVHRLVLTAFVGPRPDGMVACHNDGNPTNNDVSNLRWDSQSANIRDSVAHGTHRETRKTHCVRGHEFTAENTYMRTRSYRDNPARRCRACHREKERARCSRNVAARGTKSPFTQLPDPVQLVQLELPWSA